MQETADRTAQAALAGLFTTPQAAEFLGTTPGTLTTWRCTKQVRIPYVKIGRNIRYRLQDLQSFLTAQTVEG